ncbi:hypothetical protein B0H12DRAFT_1148330 [Mycena haematopus]|nr:hypothetical protein B0H12DRAFT_1148330 [Mycena haematopus]
MPPLCDNRPGTSIVSLRLEIALSPVYPVRPLHAIARFHVPASGSVSFILFPFFLPLAKIFLPRLLAQSRLRSEKWRSTILRAALRCVRHIKAFFTVTLQLRGG